MELLLVYISWSWNCGNLLPKEIIIDLIINKLGKKSKYLEVITYEK